MEIGTESLDLMDLKWIIGFVALKNWYDEIKEVNF